MYEESKECKTYVPAKKKTLMPSKTLASMKPLSAECTFITPDPFYS